MVAVVQLVEHQVVILAVAGSSPVSHPDAQGPDLLVWALLSFTETTALSVPAPPSCGRRRSGRHTAPGHTLMSLVDSSEAFRSSLKFFTARRRTSPMNRNGSVNTSSHPTACQ